jgi:hypothetical protein
MLPLGKPAVETATAVAAARDSPESGTIILTISSDGGSKPLITVKRLHVISGGVGVWQQRHCRTARWI